MGVLQMTAYC